MLRTRIVIERPFSRKGGGSPRVGSVRFRAPIDVNTKERRRGCGVHQWGARCRLRVMESVTIVDPPLRLPEFLRRNLPRGDDLLARFSLNPSLELSVFLHIANSLQRALLVVRGPSAIAPLLDDPHVDILAAVVLMAMDGKDVFALSKCGASLGADRDILVLAAEPWQPRGEDAIDVNVRVLVVMDRKAKRLCIDGRQ
jgi:hypothetical protein